MTTRKPVEDKGRRMRRIPYRLASMMRLLPLVLVCFFGGAVDADRLGHSLNHPRLLQIIDETTSQSSGDQAFQTGYLSGRDMFNEDDVSVGSGPDSKNEKDRLNSKSQSTVTKQKGTNLDNSEPSNQSFEASSVNANVFTELEVEDITTFVREGTSPIEVLQGSRGLVFCMLLGICATIFTAWQVADYPDGAYSSLCRWTVSSLAFLVRVLLFPFGMCCNFNNHEHVPLAKSDYGYKDPSLEFS